MRVPHSKALHAGIVSVLAAGPVRAAHAAVPNPCSLLTPARVSAVIGAPVGQGSAIGTTGCEWDATPQSGSHAKVTLVLWDAQAFVGMKAPLPRVTKTPAAGIGEDAVYATIGSLTTLSVKQGHVAFVIRVYGVAGQDKQMAIEKSLALDVVKGV
ncbi:MAG TPA: hypothetical protein VMG41_09615 [Gemmatimonadales bacterium]|nr:hypothetical protein [Gemmatimonadales bacterium]